MGTNPNADPRLELSHEVTQTPEGNWRFEDDDDISIVVLTSALFNEDDIVDDHGDLDVDSGGRGYMMNTKDWRDVEVDFSFLCEDYTSTASFTVTLGGGRHSTPEPFCEGCGYLLRMYWNGDTQMLKEQWHQNKVPLPYEDSQLEGYPAGSDFTEDGIIKGHLTTLRGTWTCLKVTRHNVKDTDGKTGVHIQAFLNTNLDRQTWSRFYSVIDYSGWGRAGEECNGTPDQVLNWAFPMVKIEWKNATRVDWYGLHVREIQPTAPVPEDPDDGNGDGGGQPEVPPPEQPTGKVEKIGSFRFSIASALATSCDGIEPAAPPQDPPPNPPDPPPATGGTFSVYWSDYWRNGGS